MNKKYQLVSYHVDVPMDHHILKQCDDEPNSIRELLSVYDYLNDGKGKWRYYLMTATRISKNDEDELRGDLQKKIAQS